MTKCCKKLRYRRGSGDDSDTEVGYGYEKSEPSCACKVFKWTSIVIFSILIILFLVIFVVFPIVFMESLEIQRKLMFPNFDQPENPEYNNYAKYDAKGVRNMYVTVNDILDPSRAVSLGVWQVVPEDEIEEAERPNFDFEKALKTSKKPICIYFHGNSGTRIFPYPTYQKLRKFFHVLAVDYRSYGDSTEALLTEEAVVSDLAQFYTAVLRLTNQKHIYFWAHSLGTALSTHTLRKITEAHKANRLPDKRMPRALMLEAPFTTMREEIPNHPIGKYFAWLPWFDATILDPLEDNGFHFWTKENILNVDCPIMIVHAKDDSIIPYTLGEELAEIARSQRDVDVQGGVILHIVPESARCDHVNINQYLEFEKFIREFLTYVENWYTQNQHT